CRLAMGALKVKVLHNLHRGVSPPDARALRGELLVVGSSLHRIGHEPVVPPRLTPDEQRDEHNRTRNSKPQRLPLRRLRPLRRLLGHCHIPPTNRETLKIFNPPNKFRPTPPVSSRCPCNRHSGKTGHCLFQYLTYLAAD